jgi:hypothetical protein
MASHFSSCCVGSHLCCAVSRLYCSCRYRLCPANSNLDEDCFQRYPLPFADGSSTLRWGGVGATNTCEDGNYDDCVIHFKATDVGGDAVKPRNSTWRRIPIPRAPWAWDATGASFEPVCKESEACSSYQGPSWNGPGCGSDKSSCSTGAFPCECSGWGIGDLFRLEIVDRLRIPTDLPPGDWVLGWRWDCEEVHPSLLLFPCSASNPPRLFYPQSAPLRAFAPSPRKFGPPARMLRSRTRRDPLTHPYYSKACGRCNPRESEAKSGGALSTRAA